MKIKDYRMIFHMAFEKKHTSQYKGIFDQSGHILHGKEFIHYSEMKKKADGEFYGKSKNVFGLTENSLTFKTLAELIDFYGTDRPESTH